MRSHLRHLVLGFGLVLLSHLPAMAAGTSDKAATPVWNAKMRQMEKTLHELLLDVSSDERFNSPKNFGRIQKNAKQLASLAHDLKSEKTASLDLDPSLKIIAGLFEEEAANAEKMLESGNRKYARGVLRSMPGYCIGCHTRNSSGPQFTGGETGLNTLSWLEKGNYLAATRRFDQALEQFERGISNPSLAEKQPFDWERAVRSALAIEVRVKRDPERALGVVEKVLSTPKAAYFLKDQATQWKETLVKWKAEPKRTAQTEEGLYQEAVRLIAEAKGLQKYPVDRSADVVYLRASAVVHELLSRGPQGTRLADALFLAGLCYEVLQGVNFWDLHEFYYLACIRQAPHTGISRQCFKHFEESVYAGYTGSAGTDIPPELELRLKELDQMSKPETATQPN